MARQIQTLRSDYILSVHEELKDPSGHWQARGLKIKRSNFGSIRFLSPVKLKTCLEVDSVVLIEYGKVDLYPYKNDLPAPGEGLNCPAEVTLERIWPKNHLWDEFEVKLKGRIESQGAKFLSYNRSRGELKFKVAHFSKYSCYIEEDDDIDSEHQGVNNLEANGSKPAAPGGLGGISSQDLAKQTMEKKALLEQSRSIHNNTAKTNHQQKCSDGHYTQRPLPTSLQAMNQVSFMGDGAFNTSEQETRRSSEDVDEPVSSSTPVGSFCSQRKGVSPFTVGTPFVPTPCSSPVKEKTWAYPPVLKTSGSLKSQLLRKALGEEEQRQQWCAEERIYGSSHVPRKLWKSDESTKRVPTSLKNEVFSSDVQEYSTKQVAGNLHANSLSKSIWKPMPNDRLDPIQCKQSTSVSIETEKKIEFRSIKGPGFTDLFSSIAPKLMRTQCRFSGVRVCFTWGSHYIRVENRMTPLGMKGPIKISNFDSHAVKQEEFAFSQPYRQALKEQLMLELKQGENVLYREHATIVETQLQMTNYPCSREVLKSELILWELCQILWPEEVYPKETFDHGFHITQHRKLQKWMMDHAPFLFERAHNVNNDSVFGLLKKGRLWEASEKAMTDRNDWLAVLLTSDPSLLYCCEHVEMACQFFPDQHLDILNLSSGTLNLKEFTLENINNMWSEDWLQYFALYLWYYNPQQNLSVEGGIQQFEAMMRKIVGDEEAPLPKHESFSVANLCVHLLKLYSCTGYPVKCLLNPSVWTRDTLDYKLSWLLMMNLERIGYIPDNEVYAHVCKAFAGQLEAIDMFEWAVFVLNKLEPPEPEDDFASEIAANARNLLVVRLLEKYIGNGDENLAKEIFLKDELNIDKKVIWTIKARKATTCQRYDQAMGYYVKAGEYQKAFNVLKKYIEIHGLDITCNRSGDGYFQNLEKHVFELNVFRSKIAGWEVQGRLLLNYFVLSREEYQSARTSFSTSHREKLEVAVLGFLNALTQYAQQAKTTREHAFLLELSMVAQKAMELLLIDENVDRAVRDQVKLSAVTLMSISVPTEYFSGFRGFLNNMM